MRASTEIWGGSEEQAAPTITEYPIGLSATLADRTGSGAYDIIQRKDKAMSLKEISQVAGSADIKSVADRENSAPTKKIVPRSFAGVVKILKSEQFDVIFAEKRALDDLFRKGRHYLRRLLPHIATSDAIVVIPFESDEPVPVEYLGAQFLTTIVTETNNGKFSELFNLDVRHQLIAVFTLVANESRIPKPRHPIMSVHTTDDVLGLIATWFPDRKKLVISDTLAHEAWTQLSPKMIVEGGVKRQDAENVSMPGMY